MNIFSKIKKQFTSTTLILLLLLMPTLVLGWGIMQVGTGTFVAYDLQAIFGGANQTFSNTQVLDTAAEGVGIGSLTVVETSTGTVKIVSNELELVGDNASWTTTGVFGSTGITRSLGKALVFQYETSSTGHHSRIGFNTSAAVTSDFGIGAAFSSGAAIQQTKAAGTYPEIGAYAASTQYSVLVLHGGNDSNGISFTTGDTVGDFLYGDRIFIKGGAFTNWTLLWDNVDGNDGTLYPLIIRYSNVAGTYDNILIPTNVLDVDTMFQPNFLDTFAGTNDDNLGGHVPEVIAGVDGVQTLGSELHTDANAASDPNGNEADATTGWTQGAGAWVFASQGGVKNVGSYAIEGSSNATPTDNARFCKDMATDFSLTAGKTYLLTFDWRHVGTATNNGQWKVGFGSGGGSTITHEVGAVEKTDTTFASVSYYFTYGISTYDYLKFVETNADFDGGVYVDNLSCKEVTNGWQPYANTWTIQSNTANNSPSSSGDTVPAGGLEDFTIFNETDGAGVVTVAENVITLTAGDRDQDYYVTKDCGSGNIGDFTHWVDVNITALTNTAGSDLVPYGLANTSDDFKDIDDASGDCIFLSMARIDATNSALLIYSIDGGVINSVDTSLDITVGDTAYLSINRTGVTMTVDIYSTSALRSAGAGGDVDVITGTVVNTAFRYVYGIGSYNNGDTAKDISGTVSNLSLNQFTENEIFATDDLGLTQGIFDLDLTIPAATDGISGMVLCLDSESSPANYIQTHYNKATGKVNLWKVVAGTPTELINETATYAAGATLRAIVDAVETTDFTTYTETDGAGKVTVAATQITLAAGDRDEDYYVTKDFGAGFFGDFTHWVDVKVTALTDNSDSLMFPWGLAEVSDDFKDIDDASGDAIFLECKRKTPNTFKFAFGNLDGGTITGDTGSDVGITVGTTVYLSINRTGTTGTVEIYSTSALRTAGASGDIDTLSITVVNTAFRYVYGLGSYNNGSTGKDISGTVSNLDLGDGIIDHTKLKVYYNGALIDSEQTINEGAIANNTRHGVMSVDSSNSLDNFTVHNRTDSNWDAEITSATGAIY